MEMSGPSNTGSYAYDAPFMEVSSLSSGRSAGRMVAALLGALRIESVLDVGCATGASLHAWQTAGVSDLCGLDGDYVDLSRLEVDRAFFHATDLSQPIELGRTFDLVQSLEVAEHIPESASKTFVQNIVRHSNGLVLFSAAPPGQGGEFHVNEQPYEFWRRLFEQEGYEAFDFVRPLIKDDMRVSYWYRYNTILYVRQDVVPDLPAEVARTRVQQIPDVSPALFRFRKAILKRIPRSAQDGLSRLKARVVPTGRF